MQKQIFVVCKDFGTKEQQFYSNGLWSEDRVDMFDTQEEARNTFLNIRGEKITIEKYVTTTGSVLH